MSELSPKEYPQHNKANQTKICIICGNTYKRGRRTDYQWLVSKYCSLKCLGINRTGDKHHYWKDNTSYSAIHQWVSRNKGNPDTCEKCGKSGLRGSEIHWANKSGKYKRELGDWVRLCASCHARYDKNWLKLERGKNGRFIKKLS